MVDTVQMIGSTIGTRMIPIAFRFPTATRFTCRPRTESTGGGSGEYPGSVDTFVGLGAGQAGALAIAASFSSTTRFARTKSGESVDWTA
jgi:hypothetical protein